MEIPHSNDPKRLELALMESKETALNGVMNQVDTSTERNCISANDISITINEVCRLCEKSSPSLSPESGNSLKEGGNSEEAALCQECLKRNTSKFAKEEDSNKRDSGFHTLNRGNKDHVDTGQQSSESGISSTSSAGSEMSISGNMTVNTNMVSDVTVTKTVPSVIVDECNNMADSKMNSKHDTSCSDDSLLRCNGKSCHSPEDKKESPKDLANRLYTFDGYKRTEVARIIGKNSLYYQEVGKEYLKLFDFTDDSLINSYRAFLSHFALLGETQERERVLSFFSSRYIECNPDFLDQNPDSVHTIVCALTLLNTDLHGNVGLGSGRKKMTYKQFATNLSGLMSDGSDYPKDLLVSLYTSIKKHPLPWGGKEQRSVARSSSVKQIGGQEHTTPSSKAVSRSLSSRSPFKPGKTTVDSSRSGLGRSAKLKPLTENHGLLWRKTLLDSDGKKVALGKRGWRMYSVTLQNLELHITKKGSNEVKTISIHHCLAEDTSTDSKRSNVFKLTHADGSVTLYQANSEKDVRKWIRNINKSAALLSAAPLCSPIGSQLVFRKALLPSAPSTLPPMNQLNKLQQLVKEQQQDLVETEKSVKIDKPSSELTEQYYKDKIEYLKTEIKRYECYIKILQVHLRVNAASSEELKSDLDKSENGSLVSVTPSEPPLASPSAFDTSDNFVYPSTVGNKSVLSPPAHFTTPQHRPSTLSPTSSLPNLSPILESPTIGPYSRNAESSRKIPPRELYESSLNDGDFSPMKNSNNSNGAVKHDNNLQSLLDQKLIENGNARLRQQLPSLKPVCKAGIQTTVIGHQTLPGNHEPFPVKRYEMRIAEMDSEDMIQNLNSKSRTRLPAQASISEDATLSTSFKKPLSSPSVNLSRVRGRKEKKGIERYSYLQAVSPIENIN